MSRDLEPVAGDVEALLRRLGMPRMVDLDRLVSEWDTLAGEPFSTMARPAGYSNGELLVEVVDGAAASLLKYRVGVLLDRLRQHLGDGIVDSIRIRVGKSKKGL
jgi:predicted nucleic acid-binding Zn ribbon protein